MSMLTIPQRFQSESASIKTSVKDGKYAEALRVLDDMTIHVGVAACFDVCRNVDRAKGLEKLATHAKASGGHAWGAFYSMFVATGHMQRGTAQHDTGFSRYGPQDPARPWTYQTRQVARACLTTS